MTDKPYLTDHFPKLPARVYPIDETSEVEVFRALLVEVYNHGETGDLHRRIGEALGVQPGEDASAHREQGQHCTTCQPRGYETATADNPFDTAETCGKPWQVIGGVVLCKQPVNHAGSCDEAPK